MFLDEFCTTKYSLVPTELRKHPHYVLWYIVYANFIFTAAIPLLLLAVLNNKICKALNDFKRRRPSYNSNRPRNSSMHMDRSGKSSEVDKTVVCRAIIIIFIVCHSVRFIMNTEEFITFKWYKGCRGRSTWIMYAKPINHFLLIINASVNFFIYVFVDNDCKEILRQVAAIKYLLRKFGVPENNEISSQTRVITDNNNIELNMMNGVNV